MTRPRPGPAWPAWPPWGFRATVISSTAGSGAGAGAAAVAGCGCVGFGWAAGCGCGGPQRGPARHDSSWRTRRAARYAAMAAMGSPGFAATSPSRSLGYSGTPNEQPPFQG